MDYLDFYGLNQEPFSTAPVSRFYYNSAQHQRALVRLMYAIHSTKGLAVLIGDLGTGKTTLARRMINDLAEEEFESALLVIIHSGITADWLLSRIARQLGVEDPAPEKLKLLNQLYSRLIELYEAGKRAVVLIDEAQMLHTKEIMEEFRGLLNLEYQEAKLITFVFFGLPDLEDHLHLDEPLAQRVALKCNLECFNPKSSEGYINHRLRLAGAKGALFTPDALKLIHHHSRGIPRLINTICDNALFEGYLLKKKQVEADLIQSVATDLGLVPIPKPKPRRNAGQGEMAQVIPCPDPNRPAEEGRGELPPPAVEADSDQAPIAVPADQAAGAEDDQAGTSFESLESDEAPSPPSFVPPPPPIEPPRRAAESSDEFDAAATVMAPPVPPEPPLDIPPTNFDEMEEQEDQDDGGSTRVVSSGAAAAGVPEPYPGNASAPPAPGPPGPKPPAGGDDEFDLNAAQPVAMGAPLFDDEPAAAAPGPEAGGDTGEDFDAMFDGLTSPDSSPAALAAQDPGATVVSGNTDDQNIDSLFDELEEK